MMGRLLMRNQCRLLKVEREAVLGNIAATVGRRADPRCDARPATLARGPAARSQTPAIHLAAAIRVAVANHVPVAECVAARSKLPTLVGTKPVAVEHVAAAVARVCPAVVAAAVARGVAALVAAGRVVAAGDPAGLAPGPPAATGASHASLSRCSICASPRAVVPKKREQNNLCPKSGSQFATCVLQWCVIRGWERSHREPGARGPRPSIHRGA